MSVRRGLVVLVPVAGCSYFGTRHADDWRSRTDVDSAELAVNPALRNIDPCRFVDAQSIKARIPRAISYGHTEGFDRCTLRLGAYDGDFVSDVSATIGFDLAPEHPQASDQPTAPIDVNGISVGHLLGPTSNRGWCRYVFTLGMGDPQGASSRGNATDPMSRVRLAVVATLSKDPGPGRPVYPCREAAAIATQAAQIRSQHLPRWTGSVPGPAGQDPCSVLADVRGFVSYRPSQNLGGLFTDVNSCRLSSGPPSDQKALGVELTLRPAGPHEPDAPSYGEQRDSAVEQRDGVELHVSTVTRTYDKPFCEVYVFLGRNYSPTYLTAEGARPEDVRVPAAVLRGTASCDDIKAVAVAAGKKFAQS
ncbi:hypothetical protein [Mycobacterium sp. D16R24]|uniref:hypothetical protein n=1 Tax=Mycobacterium sp. D16R24 TaxID=1855656 RepID=UPI0009921184|nr:hypothetical protein [Mycobacterium sp. D16R24]